ncbi:CDGSH iron-sulfur domain-containing protein [Mycolicibacter sinensis]|jgi:CDGSH-type Zn-finger protein|uniref:Iron-binding protein n=1 Tax=Mycolicibacter sinensis (strain JDM601) TaxID=875328 RepID=A0A1A2EB19_MYCSD|nr:CDGSH iron-sulfur domain-containing protein [Mycolicibacter sinensis]OBG01684.1 iron-binding protein [Mycolicibacter sinensis]OBG08164.1 iron-binding protein [Mycolicibacter sinensis]
MTEPRLVRPVRNGPVLVPGPVRIETAEGVVESDRFMVAICACGRSRNYPLCDTSHRRREPSRRHVDDEVAETE